MQALFLSAAVLAVSCLASAAWGGEVFPDGAELELLFTREVDINSGLTEGPAVAPDGSIYFTDMPFGLEDSTHIMRYDPATGETTLFTDDAGKSNGLAFTAGGYLIACDGADGGTRSLVRWDIETGERATLADSVDGRRFNSLNDLCIDSQGRIYFTDPRYIGDESRDLEHMAVYRLDTVGTVIEITHEVEKPNGIVLSPDERTLYVGDHNNGSERLDPTAPPPTPGAMKIYAFPLDEEGLVDGPRRTLVDFGDEAGSDGITVDTEGRVYLTCRRLSKPGIMVIDSDGNEVDFFPTGPENQSGSFDDVVGIPSNVEFGIGDDRHSLYITIKKSLYRVETTAEGWRHVEHGDR
jgi:gluconolactonase